MATSFKKPRKITELPNVQTPFDGPEGAAAVAEEPKPSPASPPAEPKQKKGKSNGKWRADSGVPPKSLTFFDRVKAIPFEDWGSRAKLRLYRLAPLIDRLRGSEVKFITMYEEAITEEKIKADHGSGRYRLYLNYKGAGEHGEKELDNMDFDILDPAFPPNIPAGEWMDDPRNKVWAWAKPAGAPGPNYAVPGVNAPYPAQPPAGGSLLEGMKLVTDIRKEVREELKDSQPQPAAQPAAAPATVDPWAAAERILNMRSDNPMVTILTGELKDLRDQMQKQHDAVNQLTNQLWEAKLATLEARFQQHSQPQKGLIEQAKELAEAANQLKGLFGIKVPGVGEAIADAAAPFVKSKMSGTMEFVSDIAGKLFESPLPGALAGWIQSKTQAPARPPAQTIDIRPQTGTNGAPHPPTAPTSSFDELVQFVNVTVTPALLEYLNTGNDGETFSEWLHNGFPERWEELRNLTHHLLPGMKGEPVIIEMYKYAPMWKTELEPREAQFRKFVHEFCTWMPEEEEEPAGPMPGAQEASSKTAEESGGGDF